MKKQVKRMMKELVSRVFNKAKMNVLGPRYVDRNIFFSYKAFDPKSTLEYLYRDAAQSQYPGKSSIDPETSEKVSNVAKNYIDSLESKTMAEAESVVENAFAENKMNSKIDNITESEAMSSKSGKSIFVSIKKDLSKLLKKAKNGLETIVQVETHNAQNFGALDGIISASKQIGIDDPVVYKILVDDELTCKICRKLYLMPDGITPKLYKLSEMSSTSDHKNPRPSIGISHVNCRCVLTSLLPGFGFNSSGKVMYIGNDHNEYKKQRS